MFIAANGITAALVVTLMILIGVIAVRAWRHSKVTPDERERRRRTALLLTGKLGDGSLVDIHDDLLFYSYAVNGVAYNTAQDVSKLKMLLPDDLASIGHVAIRYDARNPANSIVVAEEWTGLLSTAPAHPPAAPSSASTRSSVASK